MDIIERLHKARYDGYIKVRVGSGKRIHLMHEGSSVTQCGEWTGTSRIWQVDAEKVTCKHCGGNGEESNSIKSLTPIKTETEDKLIGKVFRHSERGMATVGGKASAYGYHNVSFRRGSSWMSDVEIKKLLGIKNL